MLRELEERHARGEPAPSQDAGRVGRIRHWALRWVAERIAEQRLLWNLRHALTAVTMFPDDMSFDDAQARVRQMLRRDARRHRLWLGVDLVLLAASAVLAIVPGPNVVAYYFVFRVGGHWLSILGARQALGRTRWSGLASAPLTELRTLNRVPAAARAERLEAIAAELALPHLPVFFNRVAS